MAQQRTPYYLAAVTASVLLLGAGCQKPDLLARVQAKISDARLFAFSNEAPAHTFAKLEAADCAKNEKFNTASNSCDLACVGEACGALSRYGIIAMGSSLDQVGPMTKTVADAELLFNVMKGKDPLDSTTIEINSDKSEMKKVIGVPWHFLKEGIDEGVLSNFKESLKKLEGLGYTIKEIELPMVKYSLPVYYVLMPAEASTNLARFDGVRFGPRIDGENLLQSYTITSIFSSFYFLTISRYLTRRCRAISLHPHRRPKHS
jgi:hypothetical protein